MPATKTMTDLQQINQLYCDLISRNPNSCVSLGIAKTLGDLPDPSMAEAGRCYQAAVELERAVDALGNDLDFDQRLDADLCRLTAKQEQLRTQLQVNGTPNLCRLPKAGEEISDGLFNLFINDPRTAAERLDNIASRITQVPRYLNQMLERLNTPVKRWVDIDVETLEGIPELFDTLLGWAKSEHYTGTDALEADINTANKAIAHYIERLQQLPTTTAFAVGRDIAERINASNGIELSLEDLHQISRDFFTDTRQVIEEKRQLLCQKYQLDNATSSAALQQFLNKKFRVTVKDGNINSILDHYQQEREKILAFIKQQDLFPVFDDQKIVLLRTPNFMAPMIPAGAMLPPAPFREGTKQSLVYLTLSEELMDEHTELSIPLMMIHEGIPGHHLQLATAAIHPTPVRRAFMAPELAEGWTTMLEDYMLDQGYMGDLTDEARFSTKLDISRIGARVVIDLYFMTGDKSFLDVGFDLDFSSDDPFENAGKLLKEVTGFTDNRVQAELNWYSQERGYPLSYLAGNSLVWQLKRDIQSAQAGKMDELELDREFHRIFIQSGNMPVAMLRKVYQHHGLL